MDHNIRPEVDRIWLWVYCNKIPIYPVFYLLKGDDIGIGSMVDYYLPAPGRSL